MERNQKGHGKEGVKQKGGAVEKNDKKEGLTEGRKETRRKRKGYRQKKNEAGIKATSERQRPAFSGKKKTPFPLQKF